MLEFIDEKSRAVGSAFGGRFLFSSFINISIYNQFSQILLIPQLRPVRDASIPAFASAPSLFSSSSSSLPAAEDDTKERGEKCVDKSDGGMESC